jgi:Pregnancy-associated plasma protein-A
VNRREFLMSSACACLATATAKIDPLFAEDAPAPRLYRCGTPPPTPAAKIQANRVITALRTHRMNFQAQTLVPIRFHIIHDGAAGKLLDRQLKAQVAMLSTIYKPSGVQFKTIDVQEYEQPEWFRHEYGTPAEGEMKTALGKDTDHCLNIYTCQPGGGLLGYATFPWWLTETPQLDGVVLHHASFPNSPTPWVQQPWPFDLGMTAVHEIGHWCGLYHTFQGGCEAPGDDVTDTPFEEGPAAGCPIDQPSSCPGETRSNPVENYMDYSDDACMKHFTPQQIQRVRDMVGYYRYKLSPQTSRSSLLEQIRQSIE